MFHVRQFPYSGLSMPARTFEDSIEARADVADLIRRRRRQGFPVTILVRGKQWEVGEPADCAMVPDACGTIQIRREDFDCTECGTPYGTLDGARACCADGDA